jgi:HK97 family phage major capsid protein
MTKVEIQAEMKRIDAEINGLKLEDKATRDTLQKRFDDLDNEFHGGVSMDIKALQEEAFFAAKGNDAASWTLYNDTVRKISEGTSLMRYPLYNGKNEAEIRSYLQNPDKIIRSELDKMPSFDKHGNRQEDPKISMTYRNLFHPANPQRSFDTGKFESSGEFFDTILSDRYDPRLKELRTQLVGSGTGGGYLVPDVVVGELFSVAIEKQLILPRAKVFPTTTDNILRVPKWADNSHTGNLTHGGFTPVWLGEASVGTPQTAVLGYTELSPRYLALYNNTSLQMESSVSNFQNIMQQAMSDSINFSMDGAFISGDGVGKPTGILKSSSLLTATKTVGQTKDTIVFDNVAKMFSMLHPSCLGSAVWIASTSTIPQLLTLYTAAGDGGQSYNTLHETNGTFTLFGKPVLFSEHCSTLGDFGDLILCDLSQYLVLVKNMILFDRSTSVEFYSNLASYRVVIGIDGSSAWTEPLVSKSGTQLSWAVALAERA